MTNLAVEELKKVGGDMMEVVKNRSKDCLEKSFNGFNSRSKETTVFLSKLVNSSDENNHVFHRCFHKIQVLQLLLFIFIYLRTN